MSETLKACPWCLRQPQLVFGDRLPFTRDHYAVYCDNRDCKIEVAARAATEAEAIAAWNRRATTLEAAALILAKEALGKIIPMDRIHGLTPGSGGRQIWHNGECGAVAQAALDAIKKLEVK